MNEYPFEKSRSDQAGFAVLSEYGRQFAWFRMAEDAGDFIAAQYRPERFKIVQVAP